MKRIVVFLLVIVSALTVACSKKELTLPEKIYKEYSQEVQEGIQAIMKEEEYDSSEYDTQVELMGELLNLYKKHGEIKKYAYEESSSMYSFTFKDGTLGGAMLKPFNPLYN